MTCYSDCRCRKVSSFIRVRCALNLQMICDIFKHCWIFSVVLGRVTYQAISYVDIRISFNAGDVIQNFCFATSAYKRASHWEIMLDKVAKVLNGIFPCWKDSLISVATDGARNITERHSGLLTIFYHATGPNLVRVWCGAHQLDLIKEESHESLLNDDFYSVLALLIAYRCRRQNLIADIKSTCPVIATVR